MGTLEGLVSLVENVRAWIRNSGPLSEEHAEQAARLIAPLPATNYAVARREFLELFRQRDAALASALAIKFQDQSLARKFEDSLRRQELLEFMRTHSIKGLAVRIEDSNRIGALGQITFTFEKQLSEGDFSLFRHLFFQFAGRPGNIADLLERETILMDGGEPSPNPLAGLIENRAGISYRLLSKGTDLQCLKIALDERAIITLNEQEGRIELEKLDFDGLGEFNFIQFSQFDFDPGSGFRLVGSGLRMPDGNEFNPGFLEFLKAIIPDSEVANLSLPKISIEVEASFVQQENGEWKVELVQTRDTPLPEAQVEALIRTLLQKHDELKGRVEQDAIGIIWFTNTAGNAWRLAPGPEAWKIVDRVLGRNNDSVVAEAGGEAANMGAARVPAPEAAQDSVSLVSGEVPETPVPASEGAGTDGTDAYGGLELYASVHPLLRQLKPLVGGITLLQSGPHALKVQRNLLEHTYEITAKKTRFAWARTRRARQTPSRRSRVMANRTHARTRNLRRACTARRAVRGLSVSRAR